MEQRLFSLLLTKGTLKLSDFWLSPVPTKDQDMTDYGATPLYTAAEKGHLEVVPFLVWVRCQQKTKAGQMMEQRLCSLLLKMGTLKLFDFRLSWVPSKTKAWQTRLSDYGVNGAKPLYTAAEKGHLEVVRFLVESSANKDQDMTDYGATPLYTAAEKGHLEVVPFLVESGANKRPRAGTDDGATPLFIAAQNGHLKVVRFPVELGAIKDQGMTDKTSDYGVNGAKPLDTAAEKGHLEVVRFLVKSGANETPEVVSFLGGPITIGRLQAGMKRVVENIWRTLSWFSYSHFAVFWALL